LLFDFPGPVPRPGCSLVSLRINIKTDPHLNLYILSNLIDVFLWSDSRCYRDDVGTSHFRSPMSRDNSCVFECNRYSSLYKSGHKSVRSRGQCSLDCLSKLLNRQTLSKLHINDRTITHTTWQCTFIHTVQISGFS
jgi:hypothetical protein